MYNYIKLVAAITVAENLVRCNKANALSSALDLDVNSMTTVLAGKLLTAQRSNIPLLPLSRLFYTVFDDIDSASYQRPNLIYRYRGHRFVCTIRDLPDYRYLVAARLLLEGYTIREEAGNLIYVDTPSGGIRRLRNDRCSCQEFQSFHDCNHRQLADAYTENRGLFIQYRAAQLLRSPIASL